MNCQNFNCNWSWDIEKDDTDPSLCHKCGYNSELGKFDMESLRQWEKENNHPFDEYVEEGYHIRTFSKEIDDMELVWHRDKEDRIVESVDETDWMIQIDNEIPKVLTEKIYIPKGVYHRVIKGTDDVTVKVKKLNEEVESIKVTRFENDALYYMCREKVNPMNVYDVYDFLEKQLYLKNEGEIVKIIRLYKHNFSYESIISGECEKIKINGDLPKILETYEEKEVLSNWLGVNPYFLEVVRHPTDTYLIEFRNIIDGEDYQVGTHRQSVLAAKQWVLDIIDSEGYSWFDEDWLSYHIEIDEESAKYNAEQQATDDTLHDSEEELRDKINVQDEYEGLVDDREYEEIELKEKITHYKIYKFKLEKLYKEKKIIEREIEILGVSLDYDYDDDGGYSEMYNVDISEMSDTLHELETVIYEYLSYIEQIEIEIDEIEESIKGTNEEISKYEGEPLIEMAVEWLSEDYLQQYSDDPMGYVNESGISIEEAISEGLVLIDETDLVNAYINDSDVSSILSTYDGEQNHYKLNGIEYYIYRT